MLLQSLTQHHVHFTLLVGRPKIIRRNRAGQIPEPPHQLGRVPDAILSSAGRRQPDEFLLDGYELDIQLLRRGQDFFRAPLIFQHGSKVVDLPPNPLDAIYQTRSHVVIIPNLLDLGDLHRNVGLGTLRVGIFENFELPDVLTPIHSKRHSVCAGRHEHGNTATT